MKDFNIEDFINDYNEAQMVVIGIGSQLTSDKYGEISAMNEMITFFNNYLDKKNYFIITTNKENIFENTEVNPKRVCAPFADNEENGQKQWDLYNKWLSATLNKELLIIELGEDFNHPNVFRWPFEKIVFINQKSKMYRINDEFYQLPENIGERACGINKNAKDFVEELRDMLLK